MPAPDATVQIVRGTGSAVAGPRSAALVDATLADPLVQALLGPVLQGQPLQDLLDVLTARLDHLPASLGLIVLDDARRLVLLRGETTCRVVRADGMSDLTGADAGTDPWVLFAVTDPLSLCLTMRGTGESGSPLTPFSSGVTGADQLFMQFTDLAASSPPEAPSGPSMAATPTTSPGSPAPPKPVEHAELDEPDDPGERAGAPIIHTPAAPATTQSPAAAAAPAPEVLPDWPPPPPPAGSDLARELADLLGATTRREAATSPPAVAASATSTRPLRLPSGELVLVGPRTILGRNPPPSALLDGQPATRVQLADPDRALSRQHLAIRVIGDEVTVEDLGSTNRSHVEVPGDSTQTLLTPGLPMPIPPNTRVVLGGSVQLLVDPR